MADTGRNARGIASHSIRDKAIIPRHLDDGIKLHHYHKEVMHGQPMTFAHASGVPAFPSASQGVINYMRTPGGLYMELFQTTAQTLMPLEHATKGLSIALDQVNNESVEYNPGGNSVLSPYARVIGTASDFFFDCILEIEDVSGFDQLVMGYRKVEAGAVPTSFLSGGDALYTDFAGFIMQSGDLKTTTDIGNAGTAVVTDTLFNWADGGIHRLTVKVRKGGLVSYFINGVQIGGTVSYDGAGTAITAQVTSGSPAYTFTSALTVMPFLFLRQDSDLSLAYLKQIEIGRLSDIGEDRSFL